MKDKRFIELHDDDLPSIIGLGSHTYDVSGACSLLNAQRERITELHEALESEQETITQLEQQIRTLLDERAKN